MVSSSMAGISGIVGGLVMVLLGRVVLVLRAFSIRCFRAASVEDNALLGISSSGTHGEVDVMISFVSVLSPRTQSKLLTWLYCLLLLLWLPPPMATFIRNMVGFPENEDIVGEGGVDEVEGWLPCRNAMVAFNLPFRMVIRVAWPKLRTKVHRRQWCESKGRRGGTC